MTHHPDTRTIENGIEQSRNRLSETLDELTGRMSTDNLAREALGLIRSNAADYTRSIDQAVRANPLALALTGAGLAWLIFGGRGAAPDASRRSVSRWEDEGGAPLPADSVAAKDLRDDVTWSDRIDALRDTASRALRRIESEARSYTGDMRDMASERTKVLNAFSQDMRDALSDGLDDLSETARARVVKMREAAYGARLRVQDTAANGGREVGRLVNDHPMIAGGLAMALGAAFAAALPRTRAEDRAFGAESDRLMMRAAEMLREERARMQETAEDVAQGLKVAARDAADTAAAKVADISGTRGEPGTVKNAAG